eukprot:PhF_6_TR31121/c1_g1_i1/m.45552
MSATNPKRAPFPALSSSSVFLILLNLTFAPTTLFLFFFVSPTSAAPTPPPTTLAPTPQYTTADILSCKDGSPKLGWVLDECGPCGTTIMCKRCGRSGMSDNAYAPRCGACGDFAFGETLSVALYMGVSQFTQTDASWSDIGHGVPAITSDPKFDISNVITQMYLMWACNLFQDMETDVDSTTSLCVGKSIYNYLLTNGESFPYTKASPTLDVVLFDAYHANKLPGFTYNNIAFNKDTKKVLWVKNDITTRTPLHSSLPQLQKIYNFWNYKVLPILRNPTLYDTQLAFLNNPARGHVFQWSVAWSQTFIQLKVPEQPMFTTYELGATVLGSGMGITLVAFFFFWLFNKRSSRALINVGRATEKDKIYKEKPNHMLTVLFRGRGTGSCGNCGKMANIRCLNCDTHFCDECFGEIHKRGKLKNHTFVKVNEDVPSGPPAGGAEGGSANPLERRRSVADLGEINVEMMHGAVPAPKN